MLTYMDFRKTNPDYQQLQEDFVDIWGKKGFYLYDHEADAFGFESGGRYAFR